MSMRRRNRPSALRDRLASIEDVYVFRSSCIKTWWPRTTRSLMHRDDEARHRAQEALADIAGFRRAVANILDAVGPG